jgi:hypothetical protein
VKKFGPRLPNFFVRGIKGSTGGGKANQGVGKENFQKKDKKSLELQCLTASTTCPIANHFVVAVSV